MSPSPPLLLLSSEEPSSFNELRWVLLSVGTWRNETEGKKNLSRNNSSALKIQIPLRNNEANRCNANKMINIE